MQRKLDTLHDILDKYTKEPIAYDKVTSYQDGSDMNDSKVDEVIYKKITTNGVTEYFKRRITDYIDVRWFGAVGNAKYVDENVGSPTYQQAFVDAGLTIPAHDDTQAFKDAIATINNISSQTHNLVGNSAFGWRGGRLKLKIPTGSWYITDGKILTDQNLPGGANSGFNIEGAGPKNTIILYRNSSTANDQYLFYDNDKFPTMIFREFSVHCLTGKEKIFYQSSMGNSQDWTLSNLELRECLIGYDIGGQFNADKAEIRRVTYVSTQPGNSFFRIRTNSQSVAHGFSNCDIVCGGVGSSVFNIQAGSSISIYSGSWTVIDKATLYKVAPPDPTGIWIANFSIPIACFGSRIEVWHDAKYIDIKTGHIVVTGEQITNFPESDGKEKIIIRKDGTVHFDKCTFADIKIAFEIENGITWLHDSKPSVIFNDCTFPDGDFTSHCGVNYTDYDAGTLVTFFPNNAGFGRILVQGSTTSGDYGGKHVDGAPYAFRGYSSRTYEKRYAIGAAAPYTPGGLPSLDNPVTIQIPLNCILIRVGIVKGPGGGGQAVQTWHVKNGDNENLISLTTASVFDSINSFSWDLWKIVATDQQRSFTLYADSSNFNLGAEGFFVVEYI